MEEILFNNNIDFESLESKLLNGNFIKNGIMCNNLTNYIVPY